MEIKIGIRNVAREVTVNVDETVEAITKAFAAARSGDGLLTLLDTSGRQFAIPATAIGFLEFGKEHARPVGFGA